MKQTSK